ncbi:uncharacterized protein LOC109831464 [Asparagus officinalis]|uniref:uncharacterized protein LOC109831464 n=1 Tax=Asparagus officinalis TaxID=4686 RepID=UPI00098E66A6|nr:uncharacterized protein LOC109831464 [Asparagus officinalis]
MADGSLLCVVTKAKSNKSGDGVFVVIKENTEIISLKYRVAERLKIPMQSLSLKFICEREKKFSISIDNDDDLNLMFETIPTENSRCADTPFTQTCNDERIPNDNPTGDSIMLLEDMLNHQTKIPTEWHTSIREVGQKFDSAAEVRLALQYYSIAKRFEYDFYHNEQRRIRVYCRFKHTHGCPWMLFASPLRNSSIMSIKNFESTHTCGQHGANAGNSRASRKFIASQIQAVLKVRPDLRAVDIKNDMLSNFGIKINYSKAWWSKETAQQDLFGDDDEAYDSLRWYESMVHATNPGSRVVIDADDGRFRRLFISYNACIEGFIAGCRPLLFLDGTFIKDRYRGILLSATGYDGNQGIFPLAYCVCDQENEVNWKWFLQGLWTLLYDRENPYQPPHRLVMISDADKGIRAAVEEFFPDAFHSRCVLHLVENFKKKMKDFGHKANIATTLGELLQSAAYKFTISEWDNDMKELAAIDHRAYVTVMEYSPERWANAHFPGIRYGHVTSNVAESFNSWIRKARLLRILPLVETIRKQIMERMHERRLLGQKWSGYLCPEAELVLSDNIQHGSCLAIKHSTEDIVEVESNKTCRVDLKNRTCSCRSWDITRIPCKHACAAITWMGREIYQYCDWYMTVVAFRASYAPIIYPIPDYEKRFRPLVERSLAVIQQRLVVTVTGVYSLLLHSMFLLVPKEIANLNNRELTLATIP